MSRRRVSRLWLWVYSATKPLAATIAERVKIRAVKAKTERTKP
jgi:hypothetical protein